MELPPPWRGGIPCDSGEIEVAARGQKVPQRDARSGPHEPLLLASSQLKGPRQRSPPSRLLALRVKEVRLKAPVDCWGSRRSDGRAQEAEPPPPPPADTVAGGRAWVVRSDCEVTDGAGAGGQGGADGGDSGRRSKSRQVLGVAAQGRLQWASCSAWLLPLPQCLSLEGGGPRCPCCRY